MPYNTFFIFIRLNGKSPKKFLFVFGFLLPCVAIVVCYSAIFYRVCIATLSSFFLPIPGKTGPAEYGRKVRQKIGRK